MSREEKAQYVIQLYKENKSIREIAKLMHMSFRDIGAIINKVKLEAEPTMMKLIQNLNQKCHKLSKCFRKVRHR